MSDTDTSYKENYVESLRQELVGIVEDKLSPLAEKYSYSKTRLEAGISWKPVVLVLGNYSSGKSTLINELIGADIQKTGQAPTDDSFTVITQASAEQEDVVIDRDGMVLLNDPTYPFEGFKKHGKRFASHFRLKSVKSEFLSNLAIIDTPGMLDSVSEKDRGYNYQEVIGEMAKLADLILVLFDPHKAGTIRETYQSLRETLPASTYEDRVMFVLNRVDECENLNDLLRVYGTLCWNLSQMTGRKDIPHVHLTYASESSLIKKPDFLSHLSNQRAELKEAIAAAPRFRLDHLATFIEDNGNKLSHYLETLSNYGKEKRKRQFKWALLGITLALVVAGLAVFLASMMPQLSEVSSVMIPAFGGVGFLLALFVWFAFVQSFLTKNFYNDTMEDLSKLTSMESQRRQDSWHEIAPKVKSYMQTTKGKFSIGQVSRDHKALDDAVLEASKDARKALQELQKLKSRLL